MESITVALDWSLNTNHTGFVVSKVKNFYTEVGLDVSLLSPGTDYESPANFVRRKKAIFGVCPSETVISSNTQNSKPPLQVDCMHVASSSTPDHLLGI